MIQQALFPDFVFEASWEVCNKVGGIYTVLSSRAKTLCENLADNLCFIGPDLQEENPLFIEEKKLFRFMLTAIMTRLRCFRLQPDVLRNVSAENACLQMPRLFTKRMNG